MHRGMFLSRIVLFLSIFTVLFISSACSESSSVSSDDQVSEITATSVPGALAPDGGEVPEDNINSEATPQVIESPEPEKEKQDEFLFPIEGIRPYAVMIDNQGKIPLPQGGLHLAQIIYEVIVEGGVTRFMPIFWVMEPTMMGPVRSSRHYFLEYTMEHDAIYVHFGWSPMAINDISKFKINNINGVGYGGEVFWDLTKDRGNWQDSYTSMEKVKAFVEKAKYRTTTEKELVFKYNENDVELATGSNVEKISLRYSTGYTCGFEYDAKSKLYLRIRQGEPHMERVSENQLTAKNIIIQKVRNFTIKGDEYGRQDLNTAGNGEGFFITDGKYIKIKWSKKSRTEKTVYTDLEDNEIRLNPGQTWVQIVPIESKIELN